MTVITEEKRKENPSLPDILTLTLLLTHSLAEMNRGRCAAVYVGRRQESQKSGRQDLLHWLSSASGT